MHGAIGYKTYRKNENIPLSPDDIHYIGSVTKTFTAVAIMKLVEDGVICLNETVGSILPQFRIAPFDKINIFHLLTHTSGMHSEFNCFDDEEGRGYFDFINKAEKIHDAKNGALDWIKAALSGGVYDSPGKQWIYCDFGFTILGVLIEKLTGEHAQQFIENNICKPLEMKDTSFVLTPDMASHYMIPNKQNEEYVNHLLKGIIAKEDTHGVRQNIPQTAHGLKSTVYDMVRYGNMMLHKGTFGGVRILGKKTVEKMITRAIHNIPDYGWGANTQDRGYGIGFDMRDDMHFTFSEGTFMHEGYGGCTLCVDPKEKLVAAWIVPYLGEGGFYPRPMHNTLNIIWSGLS